MYLIMCLPDLPLAISSANSKIADLPLELLSGIYSTEMACYIVTTFLDSLCITAQALNAI